MKKKEYMQPTIEVDRLFLKNTMLVELSAEGPFEGFIDDGNDQDLDPIAPY